MSAEAEILKSLARLEKKLDQLLSGPSGGASARSGEALSDEQLDKDWANKVVSKDPKRWSGESCVGRRYSDCPAEWHDENASFFEWKAQKGRDENPPRLKNNGKPWHESDTFEAKLCRAWAKRIRGGASPTGTRQLPTMSTNQAPDGFYDDSPADDDFPF